MDKPTSITFTDFEVPLDTILRHSQQGPMDLRWTRTQFTIPDGYDAPRAVEAWLVENCPGRWQTYHYHSPKGRDDGYSMVVRFEDKNDALMFKLRGGHQAWDAR